MLRTELAEWHTSAGGKASAYTAQLTALQEELQAHMGQMKEGVHAMRRRVRAVLEANGEVLEAEPLARAGAAADCGSCGAA